MTSEQKQRINEHIKTITIDMQAIQFRLDMLLGILAEEDKSEADDQQNIPTLDDWQQTEPRPDEW